jgi:hypothetical protein
MWEGRRARAQGADLRAPQVVSRHPRLPIPERAGWERWRDVACLAIVVEVVLVIAALSFNWHSLFG